MAEGEYAVWLKAKASAGAGQCVEIRVLPNGTVCLRDSKNPTGAVLTFYEGFDEFVEACAAGEFDLPVVASDV